MLICVLVPKETEELPEECIPDLPENKEAREFLAHAPSKGLWMPLGKEVKVMKCKILATASAPSLFLLFEHLPI